MTILWLLALLLLLYFGFYFSRGLDAPWPKVIAVICVVVCLLVALSLAFPGLHYNVNYI